MTAPVESNGSPVLWRPYPVTSENDLRHRYIGRRLADIADLPAAILDLAKLRRNAQEMLSTAELLGMGFRAHVKTHKCVNVARLQVGDSSRSVKLIVSTIAELEHFMPYLLECQQAGRAINVLYGVPAPPSSMRRIQALRSILGPDSISLLIDCPDQLRMYSNNGNQFTDRDMPIFIKVDTGYGRAGVRPDSKGFKELISCIGNQNNEMGAQHLKVKLIGFYSHMGNSYSVSTSFEALELLATEIEEAMIAAEYAVSALNSQARYVITVGATPTALSVQNVLSNVSSTAQATRMIQRAKESFDLELHAGVYPFLDLQQIATHSSHASDGEIFHKSKEDIAYRVLAEVSSVYPERQQYEVLVAAGSLALGREPCKEYAGWGIVSAVVKARNQSGTSIPYPTEISSGRWVVDRISQEHGLVAWKGAPEARAECDLDLGDRVLLLVNHACISANGFGWYLIVDADATEGHDSIVDVWVRCRGW